ncbi:hypothetical protein FHS03_001148 [Massilia violacea]|uniref:Uncharacterized protein n=1 Tax=Pseudoduganella violacea TaxID=1715466 RepID=A0A7W5FT02_9BURK|nr:hypothetical protein [Pseudoduganella violacea]
MRTPNAESIASHACVNDALLKCYANPIALK